jgi:hypothetical protein
MRSPRSAQENPPAREKKFRVCDVESFERRKNESCRDADARSVPSRASRETDSREAG